MASTKVLGGPEAGIGTEDWAETDSAFKFEMVAVISMMG